MKYRNPRWNPVEWKLVTTILLFISLWWLVPSSLFYKPTDVAIIDGRVTVTRSFPLHPPFDLPVIRYIEIVRPLPGGADPCVDSAEFRYRDNDLPTASWPINDWAAPCMTGDFMWSARWTVKLWGIIPLRPVELTRIIRKETTSND